MKTITKKFLAVFVSFVMVFALFEGTAFAALNGDIDSDQEHSAYSYEYPALPMNAADGYITASAHRAASPVLGIMGLNATSGFGMINGGTPANLSQAVVCPALGVWGSSLNDNPDPYYWNLFYNFYAESEEGQAAGAQPVNTTDVEGGIALLNGGWAGSPSGADTTLFPEYGNISGSVVSRPDILVGVDGGDETTSYAAQIATVNGFAKDSEYYREGDETYSPVQVKYAITYIKQMIESVKRISAAVKSIEEAAAADGVTLTTRYGDTDIIAADYETYVYGIVSYIQSRLAAEGKDPKIVAVVNGIYEQEDADGNKYNVYAIADDLSTSATSLVRAVEYTMPVSTSILQCEDIDYDIIQVEKTDRGQTSLVDTKVVSLDDLLKADAIVTINNSNIKASELNDSFGDKTYEGIEVTKTPSALYGVTMNSVENAMGYAYVIASVYPEYFNSVDLCAYFYEHFYHISNIDSIATVVKTNFAELTGESDTTLNTETYSASEIEAKLVEGAKFFSANKNIFESNPYDDADHNGLIEWQPDFDQLGSILCSDTHNHADYAEVMPGVAATETASGLTEGQKCSLCGHVIKAQTVIPAGTVEEVAITVTDSEGKTIDITKNMIKAAASVVVTADAPWTYGKNEAFGTFYSVKSILDSAGIDVSSAHGLKFVASDGFTTGIATDDIDALYIFDMSEVSRGGSYGAEGTYGLGINGSAGNKWATDVVSCEVASDHVWFFKGGQCRHFCSICGESEPSVISIKVGDAEAAVYECEADSVKEASSELTVVTREPVAVTASGAITVSDDAVLTVKDGTLTANKYGKAVVSASSNGYTASIEISTLFNDVNGSNDREAADYQYYYDPVYWAADNGITVGYEDGTFGAGKNCSRRELMIFLWRMAGQPESKLDPAKTFSDMSAYAASTATYKAVAWGVEQGITKGFDDGTFRPNAEVTRKDTMIMIYRMAGKPSYTESRGAFSFKDVAGVYNTKTDTYNAINWAYQNSIANGYTSGEYSGQFGINLSIERQDIVTFLYRYNNIK